MLLFQDINWILNLKNKYSWISIHNLLKEIDKNAKIISFCNYDYDFIKDVIKFFNNDNVILEKFTINASSFKKLLSSNPTEIINAARTVKVAGLFIDNFSEDNILEIYNEVFLKNIENLTTFEFCNCDYHTVYDNFLKKLTYLIYIKEMNLVIKTTDTPCMFTDEILNFPNLKKLKLGIPEGFDRDAELDMKNFKYFIKSFPVLEEFYFEFYTNYKNYEPIIKNICNAPRSLKKLKVNIFTSENYHLKKSLNILQLKHLRVPNFHTNEIQFNVLKELHLIFEYLFVSNFLKKIFILQI